MSRDFDARLSGRKLGGEGVCFYLFFSDSGGIDECLLDRWGSLLSLRGLNNGHAVQGGDPWVAQDAHHRIRT